MQAVSTNQIVDIFILTVNRDIARFHGKFDKKWNITIYLNSNLVTKYIMMKSKLL